MQNTPKTIEDFEYAVEVKLLKRFHQLYLDGKKKGHPQGFVEYFAVQHYIISEVQKALEHQDRISRESIKEIIICSAVLLSDGLIIRGHRHNHCIATALSIPKEVKHQLTVQGFVTSKNRFVDRKEAYKIFITSGVVSVDEEKHPMSQRDELYSEDLY